MPLADHEQIGDVGRFLFERGIYVTLAAYPLVPKDEVGFRIQVTAANTDEQITQLIDVLGDLADRFQLQPAAAGRVAEPAWSEPRIRSCRAVTASRAWLVYLALGGSRFGPLPVRAGVPGNGPLFNLLSGSSAVAILVGHPHLHAGGRRGRGGGSRSARRCSSSVTSTPTAIRS